MTIVPSRGLHARLVSRRRVSRRQVMGMAAAATAASTVPGIAGVDLGPHVFVYGPQTPARRIQAHLDDLYARQNHDEMGTGRYAVLLRPGRYDLDARLGHYTTVAGLGRSPSDVDIRGAVRASGSWCAAENLASAGGLEPGGSTRAPGLPTDLAAREKPYLYLDEDDRYRVFLPGLYGGATGTARPGSSVSIREFFIARPADGARRINEALAAGRHLLLTPGVYHLDQALRVTRANTVVLGLGMPSLAPDLGTAALRVDDVDGVRVAGLLVDAGPYRSAVLVEVGQPHLRASHRGNPSSVHDLFLRVGGAWLGRAVTSLIVNSDDTILDNVWAWRADRGHGVGASLNTADTGVVVNGSRVTAYGLTVENYQRYQTVWNGPGGRTVGYRGGAGGTGWASYKVSAWVPSHEAWDVAVPAGAIEAPDAPAVRFHPA